MELRCLSFEDISKLQTRENICEGRPVRRSYKTLTNDKSDDCGNLTSEHLKNGGQPNKNDISSN